MPDAKPSQPAFLLAPPVALEGSSLADLFAHPDLYLTNDSGFLLAPLYALRSQGIKAEYHALQASQALLDFCAELPNGGADYLAAVARLGSELYGLAAAQQGRSAVLDASFRHWHILADLARLYPQAPLVRLRVDPLTCLSAVLRNQCDGLPDRLQFCETPRRDLHGSYAALARALELFGPRLLDLDYALLVDDPAAARRQVFAHLGLADAPLSADLADNLPQVESPAAHLDYWRTAPARDRFVQVARDYLAHLGEPLLAAWGWNPAELEAHLDSLEQAGSRP